MNLLMYFDGGAKPNPGKGYGSYEVTSTEGFNLKHTVNFPDTITNNQAEYMTLVSGLKKTLYMLNAEDYGKKMVESPKDCHIRIYSDSRLLVNQVKGKFAVKVVHLAELVNEVRGLLSEFKGWEIHWNSREINVNKFGH
jgi:ribonuclease HI